MLLCLHKTSWQKLYYAMHWNHHTNPGTPHMYCLVPQLTGTAKLSHSWHSSVLHIPSRARFKSWKTAKTHIPLHPPGFHAFVQCSAILLEVIASNTPANMFLDQSKSWKNLVSIIQNSACAHTWLCPSPPQSGSLQKSFLQQSLAALKRMACWYWVSNKDIGGS